MVTLYGHATQIQAQARQLDPVKVLLAVLLVVPFVLGWSARFVWFVIALLITGCSHGWKTATAQMDARSAAARHG